MLAIREATGATITKHDLKRSLVLNLKDYLTEKDPVSVTEAFNRALADASEKSACVYVPAGEYRVYTIRLQSNTELYLAEGVHLCAARTDIRHSYVTQDGEGGNYDEPEVNRYHGLQDHGHSYFRNSLFFGENLENVMIDGPGIIDGSWFNEKTGCREYVLLGGDPRDPKLRNVPGHQGEWFGNKGIALLHCRHVVLAEFSLLYGGHFAIITEDVSDLLIDSILLDTTRDALDLDCCSDVTVRNSTFNSLTDDGLVMKSSYGAGKFLPLKNVLIEDCKVCGYDAGSVHAKTYTRDKLVATDRCGPTGRIKFGTEATCGYEQVTIRRTSFDRARGFAMEAVDSSVLSDIIFEDCVMENSSSSPIFIRTGERGRFPVTGMQTTEEVNAVLPNVRLDNSNWVLPDTPDYQTWPAKRYSPAYRLDEKVSVDGHSSFSIVRAEDPVRINEANFVRENDKIYAKKYVPGQGYVADPDCELTEHEAMARGNANGSPSLAVVRNIRIANVTVKNADPRYPLLLMGLEDSPIENVELENISVEFRGGLSMQDAVEQRQLNTVWDYVQFGTAPDVQTLPWLVNTFFLKNEGLLPRADFDPESGSWKADPYNVPELPAVYPEPSNWGILPAWGLYARHVRGLKVKGLHLSALLPDGRHALVLDDAKDATFEDLTIRNQNNLASAAFVTDLYRRPTNREYLPEEPYQTDTVSDVTLPEDVTVSFVTVKAPAPGTPQDSLYSMPTVPTPENGYHFEISTEEFPLPRSVHRPFFSMPARTVFAAGEERLLPVVCRNPASDTSKKEDSGRIYDELSGMREYTVSGQPVSMTVSATNLPEGAVFDSANSRLSFANTAPGTYSFTLICDDGLLPEKADFTVIIEE